MSKWLLRLGVAALALLVAVSVAVWIVLRASLPEIDGDVTVAGLDATASIARDAAGIPVITAANRGDLAFATGYAHGQDRFFQMDMIRRTAAGELAAVAGSGVLDRDKRFRLHRFRARAEAVVGNASAADRALLARYADGVNAGLASLGARPFEYLVLRAEPEPWLPEDSILVVYAMFAMLNDSRAKKEIQRGLAHSVLPPELYAWMYPEGSAWDAPLMGEPRPPVAIPAADIVSLRGVDDQPGGTDESGRYRLRGSNNWAVSGAHTPHGAAMVANDMHLGLDVPNIYYRARLRIAGNDAYDVSGVTLPGTPFVVAGSNTRIAWGFTNSYGDYTDAVVLRPGTRDGTYLTAAGEQPFVVHTETIEIKGGAPVEHPVRETIWGPVVGDIEYPDGEIAVRWLAHSPEAVNLNFLELEQADNVAAALDIANTMGMPPQNFVVGDSSGNIGWTIAGKVPEKSDFDAMLPADWSAGGGWTGWLQPSLYPRIMNPPGGRIWTANSRVVDGEALRLIGDGGYDLGARARQIREGLQARGSFTAPDMLNIQVDDRALFLTPWRDVLLELLDEDRIADDAMLQEYRGLVENWIPRAAPESVGYRLVRTFRLEVRQRMFHALTAPVRAAYGDEVELRISNQFEAALWAAVTTRPLHLLPGDHESWDEFLLAAVQSNLDYFATEFDGPLGDRTWGEINTAAIRHPLSDNIPIIGGLLNMPAEPLSGDTDLPRAQGPRFGASERFVVAPGEETSGILQMPTGQSGHPLSEFYASGHADWVEGRPSPFLPLAAQHTLTLHPAAR